MNVLAQDFQNTWLWLNAFETPRTDSTPEEQDYFKNQYLSAREKAADLVSLISKDIPGLTVHDITHLDALWEMASLVSEEKLSLNPAEAFVFGSSILLHDSAMSVAAYPGGLEEIKLTLCWKDASVRYALSSQESRSNDPNLQLQPQDALQNVLPYVLRRLHAEHAEALSELAWKSPDGSNLYIFEETDLRKFYGPTIGRISHSHWWAIQKIEHEFSEDLGALANRTRNKIDKIKVACLLRVADALHLDSRRAPRFLRALTRPTGVSASHWAFQERIARPHLEQDSVVFTTGQPFGREIAESWWLAYDTICDVDRELRDVDLLLQERGRGGLRARRVKGAGSPEVFSRCLTTRGWRPVDARLKVTDVPRIVETLGGSKLYGDDPTIPLRELIQNAADAIQARRRYQNRASDWGLIKIALFEDSNGMWLSVEDNGIGMSEHILTGPLLDFGTSFWRSPLAIEEFPGLISMGMDAIGRFGIGFFSVFMIGDVVRVYSRRFDKGKDAGRLLEFRDGTASKPILSQDSPEHVPIDGGTRVEVLLRVNPKSPGGLLYHSFLGTSNTITLDKLVGAIAPNLDVEISVGFESEDKLVIRPGDWMTMRENDLMRRLNPGKTALKSLSPKSNRNLIQPIIGEDGRIFGRAFIWPSPLHFGGSGWITVSGLRAVEIRNINGVLFGDALTASRSSAQPLATFESMAKWATQQAVLIARSVANEEHQALCAEVVLECGGTIGDLKFVNWCNEWLNAVQFKERLSLVDEILVGFDGDFCYDEDADDVHPREFRSSFQACDDVALVLRHDGSVLNDGNLSWPRSINSASHKYRSNVAVLTRRIISEVWEGRVVEEDDYREVGTVMGTGIIRDVTIFRRMDDDDS